MNCRANFKRKNFRKIFQNKNSLILKKEMSNEQISSTCLTHFSSVLIRRCPNRNKKANSLFRRAMKLNDINLTSGNPSKLLKSSSSRLLEAFLSNEEANSISFKAARELKEAVCGRAQCQFFFGKWRPQHTLRTVCGENKNCAAPLLLCCYLATHILPDITHLHKKDTRVCDG